VVEELEGELTGYQLRLAQRALQTAVSAYEHERYHEVIRLLEPFARSGSQLVSIIELLGLSYYRNGDWHKAIRLLNRLYELTESSDQDPVLADCYRAVKRYEDVEEVWARLRSASPSREVVAEGRIVYANAIAEAGRAAEGLRILEQSVSKEKRLDLVTLRQRYALAQLFEKTGDVARARMHYRKVAEVDPSLYDVAERLANLS
jgi:tetratricopeptide (TPR) repeat protein